MVFGRRISRLAAAAVAALALAGLASPAQARWLRAETARFIVYSDGDQKTLEGYARKLETLDTLLRMLHGLPAAEAPPRKLPIYLVPNGDALRMVNPAMGEGIAGFYTGGDEDIFAVAIRAGREDDILFHEYAHHFMRQHLTFGYPDWMVEGWADYYGAVTMDTRHVTYGKYNQMRARQLLSADWIPLADIVTKRSRSIRDPEQASLFYGEAWILTHYFLAVPARRQALDAALREIAVGGDPVKAMEKAAGMPLPELQRYLKDKYLTGEMPYNRIAADTFRLAYVTTTVLDPSADDLLLLNQRLKIGVQDEKKAETVALVRRLAAKHAGDPLARIAVAHAELHMGDRAEGVRLLEALLKDDPNHVEALQLLAADRMKTAEDEIDEKARTALLREASGLLTRAYKADGANYTTLYMAAEVRALSRSATYPTDNDMDLWGLAYTLAPQHDGIRMGLASALIQRHKPAQAITLLEPIANDPHGGASASAKAMIETAQREAKRLEAQGSPRS
jgi:hypothetical protein